MAIFPSIFHDIIIGNGDIKTCAEINYWQVHLIGFYIQHFSYYRAGHNIVVYRFSQINLIQCIFLKLLFSVWSCHKTTSNPQVKYIHSFDWVLFKIVACTEMALVNLYQVCFQLLPLPRSLKDALLLLADNLPFLQSLPHKSRVSSVYDVLG